MRRLFLLCLFIILIVGGSLAAQDAPPSTNPGALQVGEVFPAPGGSDIATDAVVTVIFNRPVVPLIIAENMDDLPDPLLFEPAIAGTGEWLNTSIYTFTPSVAWSSGTTYTVTVDPTLTAVDDSTLAEDFSWRFTITPPAVTEVLPEDLSGDVALDNMFQIKFNTPIDRDSFEQNFFLRVQGSAGNVSGSFSWNDDGTGVGFEPDSLLQMDTLYEAGFAANSVFDVTGSTALPAFRWTVTTVPYPAIVGSSPFDGETDVNPYSGVVLFFAAPMDPKSLTLDLITIEPEPWREPELYYRDWSDELSISFPTEPSTDYTITIAPGAQDVYGNTIETPFAFSYSTAPYDSEVSLQVPGPVGFYNAAREETQVFVTHRNVSRLDLSVYSVSLGNFATRALNPDIWDPTDDYVPDPSQLLKSWQIESVAPENAKRYELLSLGTDLGTGGQVACPGAPPSRVKVGDTVIVITDPDPLRARSAPLDGEIVELLYRDYVMPVVDGPVCAGDLLWWQVRLRDERLVWVAEGITDEMFLDVRVAAATTPVTIPQDAANGDALAPGVYYLEIDSPETSAEGYRPSQHFLIVATANLTVKTSIDSVTVWATDVNTGEPIPNLPLQLYQQGYVLIGDGVTNADGIATITMPRLSDLYTPVLVMAQTPEHFGMGLSSWSEGIDPWRFGLPGGFYPQQYKMYLYTDRPIYRPGQPVYFRGVLRSKDDVNYSLANLPTVPVRIYDDSAELIYEETLPVTEFGTISDSFDLADDAPLGFYRIEVELPSTSRYQNEGGSVFFNVAEYRLPEFQVEASPVVGEIVQGDMVRVEVESAYFFGGNVSDAAVEYTVVAQPYSFNYRGPGSYDFVDYNPDGGPGEIYGFTGGLVASGEGVTDAQGRFTVEVPGDLEDATRSYRFTVEAVVRDESNQTVAGRAAVVVHQGEFYIGARPESYVSSAGEETAVDFITVDWESQPVAGRDLDVEVVERRWFSVQEEDPNGRTSWVWDVEEIPVEAAQVTTDANGAARITFTPPNGGVFKIKVRGQDDQGNTIQSSTNMWVSSREYVSWRQQNSNRIDLVTSGTDFAVGETAEILITSPFQGTTEAFITVERGDVLQAERVTMTSNSQVYQLPITADFAPNVYVNVMLVKGVDETNPIAGFRMGAVELTVDNSQQEILISVEPDTEQAGPGDTVTYSVLTTDYAGNPVQAEVGVGLTDLASLSIGEPNSQNILDYFYGRQELAVRTATVLTINTDQITQTVLDTIKGGGGGFGEGGIFDIRQEFVDTAYWNAEVVTDAEGRASFSVTLPDNLTTWRLDARAVTAGTSGVTLVGQDRFDLLSTKPLLIRPVTPRFLVVGDEVALAAVVNNNSGAAQSVQVSIEGDGVTFEGDAMQTVTIPAGGRQQVEWWVTVDDVSTIDLTFFAQTEDGTYNDASKPPLGQGDARVLPVYKYEVPETVGTGGMLTEAESVTESIVLPEQFSVTQGELTINLDQSLAAVALEGLDYLENYPYQHAEATISRMLPNVMTYRALRDLSVVDESLESNVLREVNFAVQRLYAQQKVDGGWGWFVQDNSHPLVTAYALIGLYEARQTGIAVDASVIERAQSYLRTQFITPGLNIEAWRLDRQAFILYALARSGAPDVARMTTLYESRDRLSLYAKAMLASALYTTGDSTRSETLISDLVNAAVLSANGAHWEEAQRDYYNWNTDTRTTALVLQTLVQIRPQSELIPNVVRWLMVARDADAWETTQETAWAVMTLTDWMVASGELQAAYAYDVTFNDTEMSSSTVSAQSATVTDELMIAVADMLHDAANTLTISRTEGPGNLYYTAYLRPFLPVPEVEALNRGIILERRYTLLDDPERKSITEAPIGEVVQVRLTIIAPNDLHFVVIEDPIPAGTEGIDPNLVTNQQVGTRPGLDASDPLSRGWGWWWFSNIEFQDEKVVLNATYLPAGTYEYVYTIRPGLEGTYNVIPVTGKEFYFPEVYGRSAGSTFTVLPVE